MRPMVYDNSPSVISGYRDAIAFAENEEIGEARFSQSFLNEIESDCRDFAKKFADYPWSNDVDWHDAGINLWLTRNGHGAGFWDGDWDEPMATLFDEYAQSIGEVYIYVGDDGLVYAA